MGGHRANECRWKAELSDGTASWCGVCDPVTRLIALDPQQERMARCPDCHPLRGKLPPQFRRCGGCRAVIYAWDTRPCGRHQPVGPGTVSVVIPAPARARADTDRRALALRQAAESRAARLDHLDRAPDA